MGTRPARLYPPTLELAGQGRPARPRGRLLQLRRRGTVPERGQPGPEAGASQRAPQLDRVLRTRHALSARL